MPLAAGTRLGPYEVVAPLGAGGMGEVYRAHDSRLGRDVAIKALPAEFAQNPERRKRFEREAQTLAALSHPNIAIIHGLEERGGVPHLVLELVEGETLAVRLVRGPLTARDALAVGVQIASAIESAHERGIIHRDLKPGNVMITSSGVAKVLDFGLAKTDEPVASSGADPTQSPTVTVHPAATAEGTLLGTAAYMSPEQARGKAVDRRSDVWSFGCVLFECFTGRAPFEGATVADLLAKILEREPEWSLLPAGTPPRAREILRRCLRKEADDRPRDIRDVRLELAEIAAGGTKGDAARESSVAVLPFENLSGPDDEYFADGITDEILNALSHLDGLRVAARTSCFAFKGRREDLRSVGEKLDVTTVLEGSVRRAGARLRITVQLVNAADGYQLWSERYDREMTDVFELQDEIASAIAARLRVSLRGDERGRGVARTRNLEAYELMLRGRALHARRGRFLPKAIECLEKAIELDPRYAEALGLLSDSYRLLATFGAAPPSVATRKAKELAERAIAIDPEQAEPWSTLACVAEQFEWNFPVAAKQWGRALELEPRHSRARAQRALWAYFGGTMSAAEGLHEAKRAVEDDPLNSWVVAMHSYLLGLGGFREESIAEAERALGLDAESFFPQWNLLRAHASDDRCDHALALAPTILAESGRHQWVLGLLAWIYGRVGRRDEARAVRDEMDGRSRHEFVSPFWLATAASAAGLPDEAMQHTERAVAEHDPLVLWSRVTPLWAELRMHPRFEATMRPVWKAKP